MSPPLKRFTAANDCLIFVLLDAVLPLANLPAIASLFCKKKLDQLKEHLHNSYPYYRESFH
jgi:hypothetical protein